MSIFPELKGRSVAITGGANGIGAAAVCAFHTQAAEVFFCDHDAKEGQALAAKLGEGATFTKVDLRREKEVRSWMAEIGARAGKLDVLVNNAAVDRRYDFAKMSVGDWDEMFAINLRAYFLTAHAALPLLPRSGASIINLSSLTFHTAPLNLVAYVATKGGILGFTRSLARELGPRRVRVNTVSPGWVMTERQLRDFVTPAVKRMVKRVQCIPELIRPEEIADVVLFLASDSSRAITGQEILVDRGWAHS
jgi:NAD(P)-dependent dehydrogenase (short-subunit alcohol dehydrogenase family)